jgi:hypothetical protein
MEKPVTYNIKLQAYQLPGFEDAIQVYNKYHRYNHIDFTYTVCPMDDDGIIFLDVKINIQSGNPTALLYLGKCWTF